MTPEVMATSVRRWTEEELDAAWAGVVAQLERQRWEEREQRRQDAAASEAHLERRVLLQIGELQRATPTILAWRNEVGVGYQATILPALQGALAPFGPHAVSAALACIKRHRVAFGQPGQPDLWAVVDGRAAGLELKRAKGGVVSPVQQQWHAAARRRGCFVTVITDPGQVAPALDRARKGEVQ